MKRRDFIKTTSIAALASPALAMAAVSADAPPSGEPRTAADPANAPIQLKARLKQSVCRWCYGSMPLEDLCAGAARIGLKSVELLSENEWHIPAQHGLACALANGPVSIGGGINHTESHDDFVKESERLLPLVKAANIPSMIVFSGNRRGMSDDEGLKNCADALKRITPLAETLDVMIVMELLNSKVDHHDYQCDHTSWGVELVKRVASDRFRLLYDIYHMQIMEGDVIRTIRDNHEYIAHYHTAGVPGRREIDESQELFYPAICRAIVETGFTAYLAQEFIPSRDPITSLAQAALLCDI